MALNKFAIAASSLAAAGLIAGGATFAYADGTATASPSTQTTASAAADTTQGGRAQGQASQDTPVTGAEAQKVIDAVKAKDSTVTITEVRKDPDGTYDALGTKADGSRAFYDVSTDLGSITENAGGAGGKGGPGGQAPTAGTSGTQTASTGS